MLNVIKKAVLVNIWLCILLLKRLSIVEHFKFRRVPQNVVQDKHIQNITYNDKYIIRIY